MEDNAKVKKIKKVLCSEKCIELLNEKLKKDAEFKSKMIKSIADKIDKYLNTPENMIDTLFMVNIEKCEKILETKNNSYDNLKHLEKMFTFVEQAVNSGLKNE